MRLHLILLAVLYTSPSGAKKGRKKPIVTRQLSWEPRLYQFDNFLSAEECEYLKKLGQMRGFGPTAVVTSDGGAKVLGNTVSSDIAFLNPFGADPKLTQIHDRISQYTMLPPDHGQELAVLHYMAGQYFGAHLDAHSLPGRLTSRRIGTFFMYLSDVEGGGETLFPLGLPLDGADPDVVPASCAGYEKKSERQGSEIDDYLDGSEHPDLHPEPSDLERRGIVVRPKKGSALLWWNHRPDGKMDVTSRHTGCPLTGGEKWTVTKWLYDKPFFGGQPCCGGTTGYRPDWVYNETTAVREALPDGHPGKEL